MAHLAWWWGILCKEWQTFFKGGASSSNMVHLLPFWHSFFINGAPSSMWHILLLDGAPHIINGAPLPRVAHVASQWHTFSPKWHIHAHWHIIIMNGASLHQGSPFHSQVLHTSSRCSIIPFRRFVPFSHNLFIFSNDPFPSQMIYSFVTCSMNPKCSIALKCFMRKLQMIKSLKLVLSVAMWYHKWIKSLVTLPWRLLQSIQIFL